MRYLNQHDAQKEKDFFSKKKNGKFFLINDTENAFYPQRFLMTGYDAYDSGILGVLRNKDVTHIRIALEGTPNRNVIVKYIGGHYSKRKLIPDYLEQIPTLEGTNEVDILIQRKDYGVVFFLELTEEELETDLLNLKNEIKVEVTFEFIRKKRFLLFSRFLSKYL